MKKNCIYTIKKVWMVLLTVAGLHTSLNAQDQPFALGSSSDLQNSLKSTTSKSNALDRPVVNLRVSGTQTFAGKVNFSNGAGSYVVGELEGDPSSTFFLNINKKSVNGHIILKKEKQAYSYYSDNAGNVYVKPVDINTVLCVEYEEAPEGTASIKREAAVQAVPSLQSFPGANGCILLDFDGQYVAGTPWNNGNPINAAPSGMGNDAITEHWEIVAEDFRPFSVNVTTNEAVFNSYPKNRRMRVIITPTNTAAPGAGGVAYMNSFNWNDDTPCWVFITSGKAGGEASSHEVGHTLGLGHDGRNNPSEGYFAGHGDWAPIMGVGYYKPISQWSRGEYNSANNTQDDIATMSSSTFGLGFRADEAGNSTGAAKALVVDANGNVAAGNNFGVITNEGDWDFYRFSTGGGNVTINCNTVGRHGDLDIILRLYNSSGAQIGTYNPGGLNAGFTVNLGAGTYYVSVDGTGAGNPATDGYSAYASLGSYWISGNVPPGGGNVSGNVVVYKDCNFSGTAVGLGLGSYNIADLQARGILNDDVSSIKVQAGYEAVLYWDANFTGASLVVKGDNSCLVNNGWNDQVSSMVVRTASASFSRFIEAESYSAMAGVQTEPCNEGGTNVGYIDVNDWMAYNSITFPTTGNYRIEYRVASLSGGGRLSTDLNAGSIVLGALNVPSTGGWQNWTTISHTVRVNAGTYNLGVFAAAGGWNLNWIRITSTSTSRTSQSATIAGVDVTEDMMELYPNPAEADLNIVSASGVSGLTYMVVDATGATVMNGTLPAESISVSELQTGIYTLIVYKEDGSKLTKRFVKQ